jgi:cell division protein FtsN
MTQIKVMKLWNAFVTAFLALCTTLGLITVTATAAAATPSTSSAAAQVTTPALSPWSFTRSLPPTMKQRIRAEAHGKSPSCRHRPPTDTDEATEAVEAMEALDSAEPAVPLQR